jgi:hypothetical protein
MSLISAIATVRESVVAVFRFRVVQPGQVNGGWGSGFCVVADRYVITAFHVLNGGQPRDPQDKFLVFVVPGNGDPAFHFPVVGFPVERADLDLAVLEIGPCATQGVHIPALPVSFTAQPDGTRVITIGFPEPGIAGLNIDAQGNYRRGQFFLKSHANEGILSAQYLLGTLLMYEFNVGWHNGESGGPVVRLDDSVAAFTVMQEYRNINTPHGIVPGPHRGRALSAIQQDLLGLGATVV